MQRLAQHPDRILTPRHDDAGHLGQQVDQPIGTDRGEIRPERRPALPREPVRGLQRQPRLADPARADQRHLPPFRETVQKQPELAFPPDHPTRTPGQPGPRRRGRGRPWPGRCGAGKSSGGSGPPARATRRRVEAQLLSQQHAMVAVGVERVRDPAVGVQGAHEQRDPALPQRLGGDEVPRRGRGVRSRASAQQQLDPVLQGGPGRSSRRTAATWANPLPNSPHGGPRHSASALSSTRAA